MGDVKLGVPVTVNMNTIRLVTSYVPPKRKTAFVDKPSLRKTLIQPAFVFAPSENGS
ncbi:hypothetical protein [Mesorhizobium sp.]|uniref:hypothetical protein n=1 Tax=Mesorhizobium sp. TaxID=1871066 RepID=UPI002617A7D6|nr:hypothetical protein [Mesorhizobium sp.]